MWIFPNKIPRFLAVETHTRHQTWLTIWTSWTCPLQRRSFAIIIMHRGKPSITTRHPLRVMLSRWIFRIPNSISLIFQLRYSTIHASIVPLILIFWDVDEKHFTYAGFDHFSILISFYQLCWSYVFLFVVWDLLGKELTHICLCVWWQWINKTVAPLVW